MQFTKNGLCQYQTVVQDNPISLEFSIVYGSFLKLVGTVIRGPARVYLSFQILELDLTESITHLNYLCFHFMIIITKNFIT